VVDGVAFRARLGPAAPLDGPAVRAAGGGFPEAAGGFAGGQFRGQGDARARGP
jgi:hypothetical protein